jgi:hypothetical protein
MRIAGRLVGILLLTSLVGCNSLNTIQEQEYRSMKVEGLLIEEKNPTLAACLGVLPGCGSFYTGQYALGVLDVVTWPVSILWDPIAAYNQACLTNYQASRAGITRLKKRELAALDEARDFGRITQVEYNQSKRAIESKFGFD